MYISRISNDKREQSTSQHLLESAKYAGILGEKFHFSVIARTSAIYHDMGKFSKTFIEYLRKSAENEMTNRRNHAKGTVIHSTQGAKYILESCSGSKIILTKLSAEIAAICIAGHHGKLMDSFAADGNTPMYDRLKKDSDSLHYEEVVTVFLREMADAPNIKDLLSVCREELDGFMRVCQEKKLNIAFMLHLLVKSVYSCIVDADRYNAYCFEINQKPIVPMIPTWSMFVDRLETHISGFHVNSEIAEIRSHISMQCFHAASRPRGIYRLEVPTGGGKTLSSLRFALNHAAAHGAERIIYVIPYLSVLDQTAKEIKKALQNRDNEDFILEHHSNLILPDDDSLVQSHRLLTDRWDRPIIITTMVQFLESIYSSRSGDLRKFHNMANSVFIFDEVQSLPLKCVHLFNEVINYLHYLADCTVLLCTATQPPLDKSERPILVSDHPSLITDTDELFEKLKRTRIIDKTINVGYSLEQLVDFVIEKVDSAGNCLVILNTKRDAARLFQAAKIYAEANPSGKIEILHLSTSMCPAHRLSVIDRIKSRKDEARILCISTQLIEAGVDISFSCVVRALAGLDSIVQAAGRCNRNGENPDGCDVFIVNIADENLSKLPDIRYGRDITYRILDETDGELNCSAIVMSRYYREYFYKRNSEMDYPVEAIGTLYDLLSRNEKGYGAFKSRGGKLSPALHQAFQTAGEHFCVIEKNTQGIVVPYRDGSDLIAQYETAKLKDRSRILRQLGQYSVSLFPYQQRQLEEAGALCSIDDEILVLNNNSHYDEQLGLVIDGEMDILIVEEGG
jgi:CRISPR-associated endonuclease/helicase Cas3